MRNPNMQDTGFEDQVLRKIACGMAAGSLAIGLYGCMGSGQTQTVSFAQLAGPAPGPSSGAVSLAASNTICTFQPGVGARGAEKTVCDPFQNGNGSDSGKGLAATLYYAPNGSTSTITDLASLRAVSQQVDADIYFNQVNVPTRMFDRGFATQGGQLLQTPNGDTLYEYFGLHFESVVALGPNDLPGYYQFSILSDDGSILRVGDPRLSSSGYRALINNDGNHPTQMGCTTEAMYFDQSTRLPIQLDYYQGPRYHIAVMLLWRYLGTTLPVVNQSNGKGNGQGNGVGNGLGNCGQNNGKGNGGQDNGFGNGDPNSCSQPSFSLVDPDCGLNGNYMYFDPDYAPSTPEQEWLNLVSRGWKVLDPDNYLLPQAAVQNPCSGPGDGTGPCYTDTFQAPQAAGAPVSKVDLLIVTDSQLSPSYVRKDLALGLPSFVSALPKDTDYSVAVLLGKGSDGSGCGDPWKRWLGTDILASGGLSLDDIQSKLSDNLDGWWMFDNIGVGPGFSCLYALSNAISSDKLNLARKRGFFRRDAELVVLFLSDHDDQCSWQRSNGGHDQQDCKGLTPASVYAQLQSVEEGRPFVFGAIVPGKGTPYFSQFVSLGGGEIYPLDGNGGADFYSGVLGDLGKAAAANLGPVASNSINAQLKLSHGNVDVSTLAVTAEGASVGYKFDPGTNVLTLTQNVRPGSEIDVDYCTTQSGASPSPSPSMGASPSPSPSMGASPSPSPSVDASPSPSPSMDASPSPSPSMGASPSPSPSVDASPSPSPSSTVQSTPSPSPSPSSSPCIGLGCQSGIGT